MINGIIFFSVKYSAKVLTKKALFDSLARLFQCSRIVIAAEPTPERSILFHALLELYPEGILWTSVDARMKTVLTSDLTLVPLRSFGAGLKHILATDQNPFFFYF